MTSKGVLRLQELEHLKRETEVWETIAKELAKIRAVLERLVEVREEAQR